MKVARYSRWDGTQDPFPPDADDALRAVNELMLHGLSVEEALAWMQRHGMSLAGLSFRVMGTDQMLRELRRELRRLHETHHLRNATGELERRLDDVLDREQSALVETHGHESRALSDFLSRRHGGGSVADRIERLRDHEFSDEEAGEGFAELLAELDALRALERFVGERGDAFRGPHAADYETAQRIREQAERIEAMLRALEAGELEGVDPSQLAELLGPDAARSLVFLRDAPARLRERGLVRDGEQGLELTARGLRSFGAQALADVYAALERDRPGEHETQARGAAEPRPDETRAWQLGDSAPLDPAASVLAAVRRAAAAGRTHARVRLAPEDLRVREQDFATDATTVLLVDLSWSMSMAGRFPAAKRVALALSHLVRTRFPRDRCFVGAFATEARELDVRELATVAWDPSDPFTNLQAGLRLAGRLFAKHPGRSSQIIVVTDGQPTAYYVGGELHAEWPAGPGAVSPRAVAETLKEVALLTRRGVTINTFMLDDAPALVGFVERMTEINRGRAFFTEPDHLASFLLRDFVTRRRR